MCYPKPGPRCSNHAKASLYSAKKHYAEVKEEGNAAEIEQARQAYRVAVRRFDTTPEGQEKLSAAIEKEEAAAKKEKLIHRLKYGQSVRKSQMDNYHKLQKITPEQAHKVAAAHEKACALQLAESFARYAHRGQMRKDGTEYVEHPVRVAEYVKKFGGDREQIIAAYLHDTVEDTEVTLPQIQRICGKEVRDIVDALSHREGETYNESIQRLIRTCPKAILVKLGDNADNSSEEQLKVFRRNFSDYMRRVNKYEKARRELIRAQYQVRGYQIVA